MRKLTVAHCLIGLAAALMVVGGVSGTTWRHVVQIVPILAATAIAFRKPALGANAAMPLFVFWLVIVGLIWLFLLGLADIASGHYSVIEIVSTFLMAGFCLAGFAEAMALGRALTIPQRALCFVGFAPFQLVFMFFSFLPSVGSK